MKKDQPKYMVIYRCSSCNQESGMTELETVRCHYCSATGGMEEISRKEITPEVLAERLKALSNNMFRNLVSAFENMTEEDKKNFPKGSDAEKEMLLLLDKVKKYKDRIESLKFEDPDKNN